MMLVDQTADIAIKIKNIPMPPSINRAYRGGGNRRFLTRESAQWYKMFVDEMKLNRVNKLSKTYLIIGAEFYFKYPKKCDTLNYTKLLWDGLKKADIIYDDNQFYWDVCSKNKVEEGKDPYVNITIMSIGINL